MRYRGRRGRCGSLGGRLDDTRGDGVAADQSTLGDDALDYANQLDESARVWLSARGLSRHTISTANLGFVGRPAKDSHSRFRGAISIPYHNPDGGVRTIRFRYFQGAYTNKYDNIRGQKVHLYQVAQTTRPHVWLCEGEFDSLILTQMGFPAVGIPGSQSFNPSWKYLFTNCESVSLVFDSDEAGRKGADRLGSILGDVVSTLRRINLPPGMDVTDMYQADAEELKR